MKRMASSTTIACLLAAGLFAGCSPNSANAPTFAVTGTVTLKGEPVEGASVIFVPATKGIASATGMTDADGYYELTTFAAGDGAESGEYRVKVSKYDVKKPAGGSEQRFMTHEEEQAIYVEDTTPAEAPKNLLPPKYENEMTSGITHTVEDGPSTLDIEIE